MYYLDLMITGNTPSNKLDITESDVAFLENLFNYKLYGKVGHKYIPRYIMDTFDMFTSSKKQIILNLQKINDSFKNISHLLMNKMIITRDLICNDKFSEDFMDCNQFKPTLFDFFPNVSKIVIVTTSPEGSVMLSRIVNVSSLIASMEHAISEYQQVTIEIQAYHQHFVESYKGLIKKYLMYLDKSWLKKYQKIIDYNLFLHQVQRTSEAGLHRTDILEIEFPMKEQLKRDIININQELLQQKIETSLFELFSSIIQNVNDSYSPILLSMNLESFNMKIATKEFKNKINYEACMSWKECDALKRLFCSMSRWDILYVTRNEIHQQEFIKFIKRDYREFNNDYAHLWKCHRYECNGATFLVDFCELFLALSRVKF